jgi:hypothetical protein
MSHRVDAFFDVRHAIIDCSVIQEQIKLRENAIAQSDLLMEYKRMIVEHPSHRYAFLQPVKPSKSRNNGEPNDNPEATKEGGLLSIFTSLLAEPLSTTNRSASDHLQIELVLHFVRNILSIQPMTWCTEGKRENYKLSGELVVLLEKEMVLEVSSLNNTSVVPLKGSLSVCSWIADWVRAVRLRFLS